MSREIKFLFWDKNDKRMVPWKELLDYISTNGSPDGMQQIFDNGLQCTGLKDMNGIDIYEGCILEYVSPPEHREDDRPDHYLVEWRSYGFEATWINPLTPSSTSDGHLALNGADRDMKIIGNRYENPELLGDAS